STPGYARLRPRFEDVVLGDGSLNIPGGVQVAGIEGLRSQILDQRVAAAQSGLSGAQSSLRYLSQLEGAVAPGGQSALGDSVSAFFASLQQLTSRPEDPALRSGVIDAATTLAARLKGLADTTATAMSDAQS